MSILEYPNNYMPRVIDEEIEKELSKNGAVRIEGPKRCGKTWTAEYHCKSGFFPQDPYKAPEREAADKDKSAALKGDKPRLLDEWQVIDGLLDAASFDLDRSGKKGQYVLTGSVSPNARKNIGVRLGQIKVLKMRTMSLYETGDSKGEVSLKALCDGKLSPCETGEVTMERLVHLMTRGGWPDSQDAEKDSSSFSKGYTTSIVEDGVRELGDGTYNIEDMKSLLRSLARNEAEAPDMNTLVEDVYGKGSSHNQVIFNKYEETIKKYLNFFDMYYLFDNTENYPFSDNPCSPDGVGNEKTGYFCDVSLPCALLGIDPTFTPDKAVGPYLATLGHLFESLCVHDLKVYAQSFGATVYHYRENRNKAKQNDSETLRNGKGREKDNTDNGNDDEIDAVIKLPNGKTCAFEIKLGWDSVEKASNKLLEIQKNIEQGGRKPPSVLCVICGTTDRAYRRDDGVFVVPITALKP